MSITACKHTTKLWYVVLWFNPALENCSGAQSQFIMPPAMENMIVMKFGNSSVMHGTNKGNLSDSGKVPVWFFPSTAHLHVSNLRIHKCTYEDGIDMHSQIFSWGRSDHMCGGPSLPLRSSKHENSWIHSHENVMNFLAGQELNLDFSTTLIAALG